MENVILIMKDELTGEQVERTISAVNAMTSGYPCYELKGEAQQRKALESWINERGNEQHETILTLQSWNFA